MASQTVCDRDDRAPPPDARAAAQVEPSAAAVHVSTELDDLTRPVYGVLGIPIDAVDMETAQLKIAAAASRTEPFLISTANLNFLVASLRDTEFRESLLVSNLCSADGAPVVWAARMLGAPMSGRLAGSDMFVALSATKRAPPLKTFLFGGEAGVAAKASQRINAERNGVTCVGTLFPGFGSVADMSADNVIEQVNASQAQFLVVALGAKKGQAWLLQNHSRLTVPVRVHLGATINFVAGTVRRAPEALQRLGLEWFWRITEEPQLWRRYWSDGLTFIRLIATRVVPLLALQMWYAAGRGARQDGLSIGYSAQRKRIILSIKGRATCPNIEIAINAFRTALAAGKDVTINFDDTELIDARFLGLLLMLYKNLKETGRTLSLVGVPARIARLIRLNEFGFLLHHEGRA